MTDDPETLPRSWSWNGQKFSPCLSIPLSDRGFRYGMAVFESFRVSNGTGEFLQDHLARLIEACAQRQFAVDLAGLQSVAHLIANLTETSFTRIYVTAGDGAPTDPAPHPRIFVFSENRPAPLPNAPCALTFSKEIFHPLFGGLKTANYWPNLHALAVARQAGFDEALLFNQRDELVSACTANVFLVHGHLITTPHLASGARPGVIRHWVASSLHLEERPLRYEDVQSADAVFLTNSWTGILSASSVEKRFLPISPIAQKLHNTLASSPKCFPPLAHPPHH
jgi:4-amino-4-deoxychorismate lyase